MLHLFLSSYFKYYYFPISKPKTIRNLLIQIACANLHKLGA
jgi:hypothetical protein